MKKIIATLTIFLGLLMSSSAFAGNGLTYTKWILMRQNATPTPFAYTCDYVRSVYQGGYFITQQYWTGAAWWSCPVVI